MHSMSMVVWFQFEVKAIELVYGQKTGEMLMLRNVLGTKEKRIIIELKSLRFFCE